MKFIWDSRFPGALNVINVISGYSCSFNPPPHCGAIPPPPVGPAPSFRSTGIMFVFFSTRKCVVYSYTSNRTPSPGQYDLYSVFSYSVYVSLFKDIKSFPGFMCRCRSANPSTSLGSVYFFDTLKRRNLLAIQSDALCFIWVNLKGVSPITRFSFGLLWIRQLNNAASGWRGGCRRRVRRLLVDIYVARVEEGISEGAWHVLLVIVESFVILLAASLDTNISGGELQERGAATMRKDLLVIGHNK